MSLFIETLLCLFIKIILCLFIEMIFINECIIHEEKRRREFHARMPPECMSNENPKVSNVCIGSNNLL